MLRATKNSKKFESERDQRLARFKRSALRVDDDPKVDEYVGEQENDYVYNIGYTQTTKPALTATKPPEYLAKTGYYGRQGIYFTPVGNYRDHPVFTDMKNHNPNFTYNKGLTHTNIADDRVREDNERWNTQREMRVMSRNFTSLSQGELEERAMRKTLRGSSSVMNMKHGPQLMPKEVDPSDPHMRASVYNPYGKLLGTPYLKTPNQLDQELFDSINTRYQNTGIDTGMPKQVITSRANFGTPRTYHQFRN